MSKTALLISLLLALLLPAGAQPGERVKARDLKADVRVVKSKATTSPDFNKELLEYTVQVTNRSSVPIMVTNNRFLLKFASGATKTVNRGRYPTRIQVEPNQSATVERVYFDKEGKDKPVELQFVFRGRTLGSAKL